MTGKGYTGPMGAYLSVSFDNKDWHIMIRRTDGKALDAFMEYHGRTVTQADVATLGPNWNSLEWHPVVDGLLHSRGTAAGDREKSVRLLTTEDSPLSNEQIIEEFKYFMAGKGE
ncbi:MAG TPA: hypothetical protein VMX36_15415 [Sedimentisphaerales bacterium]|nr:hypothetical protein [Sedimentisphaerales bacterium]